MGDVIPNTRFPKPKTDAQRQKLRSKFARRPLRARPARDGQQMPAPKTWRR